MAAQTALCSASEVVAQEPTGSPVPPRLRLTTETSLLGSESVRVAVTQSRPQMICE
ncbi:MAG TPA: hypothetical protein VLR26_09580 [Frankiaceae bacterium]|nr:hypothetical protein [Frankiaceae bacterium]